MVDQKSSSSSQIELPNTSNSLRRHAALSTQHQGVAHHDGGESPAHTWSPVRTAS